MGVRWMPSAPFRLAAWYPRYLLELLAIWWKSILGRCHSWYVCVILHFACPVNLILACCACFCQFSLPDREEDEEAIQARQAEATRLEEERKQAEEAQRIAFETQLREDAAELCGLFPFGERPGAVEVLVRVLKQCDGDKSRAAEWVFSNEPQLALMLEGEEEAARKREEEQEEGAQETSQGEDSKDQGEVKAEEGKEGKEEAASREYNTHASSRVGLASPYRFYDGVLEDEEIDEETKEWLRGIRSSLIERGFDPSMIHVVQRAALRVCASLLPCMCRLQSLNATCRGVKNC